MDDRLAAVFGFRIEHRRPDGSVRLLAETTMRSVAHQSALAWRRRLRRAGQAGTVVVVLAARGEVVSARAIGARRADMP